MFDSYQTCVLRPIRVSDVDQSIIDSPWENKYTFELGRLGSHLREPPPSISCARALREVLDGKIDRGMSFSGLGLSERHSHRESWSYGSAVIRTPHDWNILGMLMLALDVPQICNARFWFLGRFVSEVL